MNQIVDHSGAEADAAREPGVPAGVPVDYYASYMGLQGEMEQVLRESARQAEEIVRLRGLLEAGHGRARTNTDGHRRKWAGELPALPEILKPTDIIQWAIIKAGIDLINLLLEKNRMYGASVFFPTHTFARASWREAIYVRLDDKLARLRSGQADDKEDPSTDIAGYLVLEKSGRLLEDHGVIPAAGAPGALSAAGGFCAASSPMLATEEPSPSRLDNIDTVKDLLIKAESEASELRAQNERLTSKLEAERDDALFTAQTLKDERDALQAELDYIKSRRHEFAQKLENDRDALQARIDAGVRVWVRQNSLFKNLLIDHHPKWGGEPAVLLLESQPTSQDHTHNAGEAAAASPSPLPPGGSVPPCLRGE